ncbi:MAG: hypothetical protein VX223_09765, partial [Myxococcota bacterium]|nr:hypothetical protein [Myxococcota bacterium]
QPGVTTDLADEEDLGTGGVPSLGDTRSGEPSDRDDMTSGGPGGLDGASSFDALDSAETNDGLDDPGGDTSSDGLDASVGLNGLDVSDGSETGGGSDSIDGSDNQSGFSATDEAEGGASSSDMVDDSDGASGSDSTGNTDGSTPVICTGYSDCVGIGLVCDTLTEQCVECVYSTHCESGQVCIEQTCIVATPCSNDLDCKDLMLQCGPPDAPGAQGESRCVECTDDSICGDGETCQYNQCIGAAPDCANIFDCESPNKLCISGECLSCESDSECGPYDACIDGQCASPCHASAAEQDGYSYGALCSTWKYIDCETGTSIGCSFVALDLQNAQSGGAGAQNAQFAIVVSNVANAVANVTVTLPDSTLQTAAILPKSLKVFELPAAWSLSGTSVSTSAFEITSDVPVAAYQFNPYDNDAFSADASVLLPTTSNGVEYYIASKPSNDNFGAYFAVVATSPGETGVTVYSKCSTAGGGGLSPLSPNTTGAFTLTEGQVANVVTLGADQDLTGTRIVATQPIAVFSGHTATTTANKGYSDHIEQQMAPTGVWGAKHLVGRSEPRGTEPEYVRVIASQDGTSVALTPSVTSPNTKTLNAGDYWEFTTYTDVLVTTSQPVMVVQLLASSNEISKIGEACTTASECDSLYLCEQGATLSPECTPPSCTSDANCPAGHLCLELDPLSGEKSCYPIGDPALILVSPVSQWLPYYVFFMPSNYAEDYVTITTELGTEVVLDGVLIPASSFTAVPGTGYVVHRQMLTDGVHEVSGNGPLSSSVYGYDRDVSYGYPGGLGLASQP